MKIHRLKFFPTELCDECNKESDTLYEIAALLGGGFVICEECKKKLLDALMTHSNERLRIF